MRLPLGLRNPSRIGRERNVSVVRFQLQKTPAFLNVPLVLPRRSPAVHEADSLFLTITWTMLRLKKHNYKHKMSIVLNYKDKDKTQTKWSSITKTKCLITDYCIPPCLSYPPQTGAVQETTLREDARHPLISDYNGNQE